MPNIESIIASHNSKLLTQPANIPQQTTSTQTNASNPEPKECNCRVGTNNCPMKGKCLTKSLVYRAEIISHQDSAEYIGLTSNSFKQRYLNHISSFKNIKYKESTALAKYIWKLKDEKKEFNINWSVAAKAPPYNPVAKSCHLCITEKAFILRSKHQNLINKRNELMGSCLHRRKFLLSSIS